MKYLGAVNAVLQRLREEPVSSSDEDEYAQLIRQFVDETKEDIEERWDWNKLRHSIVILTDPGETKYISHGVGDRVKVLEVVDGEQASKIHYGQWAAQNRLALQSPDVVGRPHFIDRNGFDVVGDPIWHIYPKPDAVYTVVLNAIVPQQSYDGVHLDDVIISIPSMPLVLGAYIRAIEERGDDAASRYQFNLKMYEDALFQSINRDMSQQAGESSWRVEGGYENY